mmetsp:Transcript_5756/g.12182  ORF Transcript_5756/g.12182 Transcript_5756/m.12182 type:complete len:352 (-) Transcript_5756:873-1928(-)
MRSSNLLANLPALAFTSPRHAPLCPYAYDLPLPPSSSEKKNTDGIECLLQAVAPYRRRDPQSPEEAEHLENLFTSLRLAGTARTDHVSHLVGELQGVELMIRIVGKGGHGGAPALRTLADMVNDNDERGGKEAAARIISAGGLRIIPPMLMGKGIPRPAPCTDAGNSSFSTKEGKISIKIQRRRRREREEHRTAVRSDIIYILYGLARHIASDTPEDARDRFLLKFTEDACAKADRLVELLLRFDMAGRAAEARYLLNAQEDDNDEGEDEENLTAGATAARLAKGGDLFHRTAAVLGFVCIGSRRAHEFVLERLRVLGSGIGVVKVAIMEFSDLLDDSPHRDLLLTYLDSL